MPNTMDDYLWFRDELKVQLASHPVNLTVPDCSIRGYEQAKALAEIPKDEFENGLRLIDKSLQLFRDNFRILTPEQCKQDGDDLRARVGNFVGAVKGHYEFAEIGVSPRSHEMGQLQSISHLRKRQPQGRHLSRREQHEKEKSDAAIANIERTLAYANAQRARWSPLVYPLSQKAAAVEEIAIDDALKPALIYSLLSTDIPLTARQRVEQTVEVWAGATRIQQVQLFKLAVAANDKSDQTDNVAAYHYGALVSKLRRTYKISSLATDLEKEGLVSAQDKTNLLGPALSRLEDPTKLSSGEHHSYYVRNDDAKERAFYMRTFFSLAPHKKMRRALLSAGLPTKDDLQWMSATMQALPVEERAMMLNAKFQILENASGDPKARLDISASIIQDLKLIDLPDEQISAYRKDIFRTLHPAIMSFMQALSVPIDWAAPKEASAQISAIEAPLTWILQKNVNVSLDYQAPT